MITFNHYFSVNIVKTVINYFKRGFRVPLLIRGFSLFFEAKCLIFLLAARLIAAACYTVSNI